MALDVTVPTLPPTPCKNLATINVERVSAVMQMYEAIMNKMIPEIITGFLPSLSDKKPMNG